jgi:protein gp37
MQNTNIQWTDNTWNIARGCTKVDEDCKYCYMYRDSMENTRYNPLDVVRTKTVFNFPLKYKETMSSVWPGRPLIFTSSLTDVFHPAIDGYRNEMWDIIRQCPHLIFQILTKRPERMH